MLLQPFSSGCFCVYCTALITILELYTAHVCMYVFVHVCRYSETSLQWTRTGPEKMSTIEGCPLKREVITLVHYVTDLKNRP
jgi:hypothetical protein